MNRVIQKYFETSTIHGFSYLTDKYRLVERIFWVLALILSLICTILLTMELAVKIQNFPIVIFLSEHQIHISELNFPAVTFCPGLWLELNEDLIYKNPIGSRVLTKDEIYFNFEQFFENETNLKDENLNEIINYLQVVDLVTQNGLFSRQNLSIPIQNFKQHLDEFRKYTDYHFNTIFWQTILSTWRAEILTQFGLCYSFNIVEDKNLFNLDQISADFRFTHKSLKSKEQTFQEFMTPLRTNHSHQGVFYFLDQYKKEFNERDVRWRLNDFDGYLMFVHDPYELPTIDSVKFVAVIEKHFDVFLTPEILRTDESLAGVEAEERNCYFENERKLKFFKVYTKHNCEQECLSNITVKTCGCAQFFMIRDNLTRICMASEKQCYDQAKLNYDRDLKKSCHCYPACNTIEYSIEVKDKDIRRDIPNPAFKSYRIAKFQIKFSKSLYNAIIRKKMFTRIDFISFVAGVLELFSGLSLISFIELFFVLAFVFYSKIFSCKRKVGQRVAWPENEENFQDIFHANIFEGFTKKNWHVKIIWGFSVGMSLLLCVILMAEVKKKIQNSRIIAIEDFAKVNGNISFPALTFINGHVWNADLKPIIDAYQMGGYIIVDNEPKLTYLDYYDQNMTAVLETLVARASCRGYFMFITPGGEKYHVNEFFSKMIRSSSPKFWFMEQFANLNGHFSPKFSESFNKRGSTFTFNLMEFEELFRKNEISSDFYYDHFNLNTKTFDYFNLTPLNTSKPYVFTKKDKPTFTLKFTEFNPPQPNYKKCLLSSFAIHSTDSASSLMRYDDFIEIQPGLTLNIQVIPEIIKTDPHLRSISPNERECLFEDEKFLRFFNFYSTKNCELECLANFTLEKCQCVTYDLPRDENTKVCTSDQVWVSCDMDARHEAESSINFTKNCGCLPNCNSIEYRVKVSPLFHRKGDTETIIKVAIDVDEMVVLKRFQQFTTFEAISYVGGLLGLLAGVSVLSFVEIFYFVSLKAMKSILRVVRRAI